MILRCKNIFSGTSILQSFFCMTIILQACTGSQIQIIHPEHFSHRRRINLTRTSLVPSSGKTLEEYIRPSYEDPNLPEKRAIFQQGWLYFQQKDWEKAQEWFEKASKEYPYLKDFCHFYIAGCLENNGKYKEAISLLNKTIKLWPSTSLKAEIYLKLAEMYFYEKDYAKAIEAYEISLKIFPEEKAYIQYQIALAHLETGKWSPALEKFKSLLIKEPDSEFSKVAKHHIVKLHKEKMLEPFQLSPQETFQQAERLFEKRKYDLAIKSYLSVINSEPEFSNLCQVEYNLAQCYKRTGRKDLAIHHLEKIAGTFPKSECVFNAKLLLARTFWNEGRSQAAYKILEGIRKDNPTWEKNIDVLYIMGRMAEEEGRYIDSVEYYKKIIATGRKGFIYREAVWRIGWNYYNGRHYRLAAHHFNRYSSKIDDEFSRHRMFYWEARAEEKRGNAQNATQIYQTILQEPYWSFYSGLAEIRLRCSNDPNQVYTKLTHDSIDAKEDIFLMLSPKDKDIVIRVFELYWLGLKDESVHEIRYQVYTNGRRTPSLLFCLSSMAHMNGAHELGIRIGFLWKISRQSEKELSEYKENLLLYPLGFSPLVEEKARRYNLDPLLVFSVIRQESLFDPFSLSQSSAYGLMQIIPSTGHAIAKELGMDISSDITILFDQDVNLTFGCFFLKSLLDQYDQNIIYALASYNAGPGAVKRWHDRFGHFETDEFIENIPYRETRDYVKRIMKNYWIYKRMYTPVTILEAKQVKEATSEKDSYCRR